MAAAATASADTPQASPRPRPAAVPDGAKRPASATIAATPLERLPGPCIAKAHTLLRDAARGGESLKAWLRTEESGALWKQGVLVDDVLAAVKCFACETPRLVPGERRGETADAAKRVLSTSSPSGESNNQDQGDTFDVMSSSSRSSEARYAVQLLAQVLWEEQLAKEETQAATQAKAAATEGTAAFAMNMQATDGVAAERRHDATAKSRWYSSRVDPLGRTGVLPRPGSANILRGRLRTSDMQERWKVSIERAKLSEQMRHESLTQQWYEKEQVIQEVRQRRMQHFQGTRSRSQERVRRWEEKRNNFLQEEERREVERRERLQALEKELEDRPRICAQSPRETPRLLLKRREEVSKANQDRLNKEEEDKRRAALAKAEQAQEDACARRRQILSARGARSFELKMAGELAKKQAVRIHRIREAESVQLRQKLDALASRIAPGFACPLPANLQSLQAPRSPSPPLLAMSQPSMQTPRLYTSYIEAEEDAKAQPQQSRASDAAAECVVCSVCGNISSQAIVRENGRALPSGRTLTPIAGPFPRRPLSAGGEVPSSRSLDAGRDMTGDVQGHDALGVNLEEPGLQPIELRPESHQPQSANIAAETADAEAEQQPQQEALTLLAATLQIPSADGAIPTTTDTIGAPTAEGMAALPA